ncbi:MAG: hypothetical protein NZM25_03685 [Leptospiraceae bacterium]|nr:hypothetical protein [Leptospiraceae bacterium]MDW8306086.1 hypothetical protein [Leptospiraceae bacterium]
MEIPLPFKKELSHFPGVFLCGDESLFIQKRPAVRGEERLRSREVHLKDLGLFPLEEKNLSILEESLAYKNHRLTIPPLLKNSRIPIFYAEGPSLPVYIPLCAFPVLRYFSAMWEYTGEGVEILLMGFLIVDSFVGGSA